MSATDTLRHRIWIVMEQMNASCLGLYTSEKRRPKLCRTLQPCKCLVHEHNLLETTTTMSYTATSESCLHCVTCPTTAPLCLQTSRLPKPSPVPVLGAAWTELLQSADKDVGCLRCPLPERRGPASQDKNVLSRRPNHARSPFMFEARSGFGLAAAIAPCQCPFQSKGRKGHGKGQEKQAQHAGTGRAIGGRGRGSSAAAKTKAACSNLVLHPEACPLPSGVPARAAAAASIYSSTGKFILFTQSRRGFGVLQFFHDSQHLRC